jgi:hypothetical protein
VRGIAYDADDCAQKECRAKREEGLTDRLSLSASKDAVSLKWKGPADVFATCPGLSPDYRGQRSQKDKLRNRRRHCGGMGGRTAGTGLLLVLHRSKPDAGFLGRLSVVMLLELNWRKMP